MSVNGIECGGAQADLLKGMRRGLVRELCRQHRGVLLGGAGLWFTGIITLQLAVYVEVILICGSIYALMLGTMVGGVNSGEGTDEFSFALPLRRERRFMVQYLVGLVPLAGLVLGALVVLGTDLSQHLWGLVVESGFTGYYWKAYAVSDNAWVLAAFLPPFLYTATFTLALMASEPRRVGYAPYLALLLLGIPFLIVELVGHRFQWSGVHEWALASSACAALATLLWGIKRYPHKVDAFRGGSSESGGIPFALVVVLVLLALVLLALVAGA